MKTALLLFLLAATGRAADSGATTAPPAAAPVAAPQQTALHALDARLTALATQIEKIDVASYRATNVTALQSLRSRRVALAKMFDSAESEALMQEILNRFQIIALWLAPPRVPPPSSPLPRAGGK